MCQAISIFGATLRRSGEASSGRGYDGVTDPLGTLFQRPANPNTTSNYATSETVYDSLGKAHHVDVYFRAQGNGDFHNVISLDGGVFAAGAMLGVGEIEQDVRLLRRQRILHAQAIRRHEA